MKKYIITHEKMPGEVELSYDNRQVLCGVIVRGEPKPDTLAWLLRCLPMPPDGFPAYKKNGFVITEVHEEITFDKFWNDYALKLNVDRCRSLWQRMSAADRTAAHTGIAPYDRHLAVHTWQAKANPESYLKKKMWKNEWNKVNR